MRKKTIRDIAGIAGQTVFLTVDFNISLKDGKVTNDTRIVEAIPTIKYLLSKKAKIVLASHLGRPKGVDPKFSLKPVAERVALLTGKKVNLIEKYWEKEAVDKIRNIPASQLTLLDNIRFSDGEKKNDPAFAKHLASMADIFVNDAFGSSHRTHASIVGITEYLKGYAGLLMEKEINMISDALEKPKRPFLVIIGGAKTPEKISVIERILDIADTVALGGAIANTFLAAWGFGMGQSIVDYEMVEMARVVFWKTTRQHSALLLPLDVVISDNQRLVKPKTVDYTQVPPHVAIFDIGPKTCNHLKELIKNAGTIIWNGPMGLYEDPRFAKGTDYLLECIANSHATTIIGGGDTLTSIKAKSYLKKITHISTGGSAMLEFMKIGTLPGIEVLENA